MSVAEDGESERDIIMWMDHRAADEAAAINATRDPALAYVGGEVSIEMELPKVLWLRRHFPDRYAAVARFFDLADYLVWSSCGADTASVCTLTCKWNYLAHEGRFPDAMLRAVGLDDLAGKVPRDGPAARVVARNADRTAADGPRVDDATSSSPPASSTRTPAVWRWSARGPKAASR